MRFEVRPPTHDAPGKIAFNVHDTTSDMWVTTVFASTTEEAHQAAQNVCDIGNRSLRDLRDFLLSADPTLQERLKGA